jgi:hypothetical protein
VYLVPLGAGRFELYSEPSDDAGGTGGRGYLRRQLGRLQERWRAAVQQARRPDPRAGIVASWRDKAICRIAEMVAEQRTLWALRNVGVATLVYPSDLTAAAAAKEREHVLQRATRYHGIWTIVDTLLFIGSGLLMLVPGPNVLAYYFGVRLVGHFLSWRGARRAQAQVQWTARDEPALAELGALAAEPREARASRVAAVAMRLNLPRLAAFFDRVAVPAH